MKYQWGQLGLLLLNGLLVGRLFGLLLLLLLILISPSPSLSAATAAAAAADSLACCCCCRCRRCSCRSSRLRKNSLTQLQLQLLPRSLAGWLVGSFFRSFAFKTSRPTATMRRDESWRSSSRNPLAFQGNNNAAATAAVVATTTPSETERESERSGGRIQ